MLRLLLAAVLLVVGAPPATASPIVVRDDLRAVFQRAGTQGTFALYDVSNKRLTVVDTGRAFQRRIPASTFKIANTLIALETGAVSSVDEVLPYGGKPQPFPEWERDMSMREAIKLSAVPIYQEVARRIGLSRMTSAVDRLGYGNERVGPVVDRFWLDGPLKISPVEQTRFLARLDRHPHYADAREILEISPGLFAKTGWVFHEDLGWWVGWVERDGRKWTFALQMDLPTDAHVGRRIPIGKELLTTLGVPWQ